MKTIVKLSRISKKYGKIKALDNLSFSIEKGNIYGLLGPNGSGKSTILGILLGVVNKDIGDINWFEQNLKLTDAIKHVGAIIERPNFYPYMTAEQNLKLVCKIKNIPPVNIDEKLKTVNLYERKNDKFKTYSLGMKQRLAIASALINNPELLILDEPTNGLDPKGIKQIRDIITKISKKGTTIILASHLLDEVEKVCNKVIVLQKGKKIFEGNISNINNEHYYFELETTQPEKAVELLKKNQYISKINLHNNNINVYTDNLTGSELNKFLAENNIYVSKLLKKEISLEDKFIKITE